MPKIALIANGISADDPEALENILRSNQQEVDVFDVRTLQKTPTGFAAVDKRVTKNIDPAEYAVVARIIKGGVSGDTVKSWELQKFFEDAGAEPHIKIEAARKVTDKILCKETLVAVPIPVFLSTTLASDENKGPTEIKSAIQLLGEPPYAVRKSIGSGKDSLAIADTLEDALCAVQRFCNPSSPQAVKIGVIVHKLPATLDVSTIQKYDLKNLIEAQNRTYQFRVILIDNKLFGASIGYSEPGKFGLNPAQGVTFKALPETSMPMEVLQIAKDAAAAHDLKIAAVDIVLDSQFQPRVLDMNASPDLSFANTNGERLSHAVAQSIQTMAARSSRAEPRYRSKIVTADHN